MEEKQWCRKCDQWKDSTCFKSKRKDGWCTECRKKSAYERTAQWRLKNKQHLREYSQKRRLENPEKVNNWCEAWRENNREKCRQYSKDYRNEHLEEKRKYNREWYRANRNHCLENQKAWKTENPDKLKAYDHTKRGKRKEAKGCFTFEQWLGRLSYHEFKCRYCGCSLDKQTAQIEHMIPISKGGTNWPSNLVPACRFCNTSKKDKNYHHFIKYIKENPHIFSVGFFVLLGICF